MTELEKFNETIAALENGSIRVAEKKDGRWQSLLCWKRNPVSGSSSSATVTMSLTANCSQRIPRSSTRS